MWKVQDIITRFPKTNDNNEMLIWFVWYYHDLPQEVRKFIPPEIFSRLTRVESIVRSARKLREKGIIPPPSRNVREGREIEEQEYRDWAVADYQ